MLGAVRLYHGTPNLARVLRAGIVKPSDKPEPLPDLTAALGAYRTLLAKWLRRWPDPSEPWQQLDVRGYGNWLDVAIVPMRRFAYATTKLSTAQIYAGRKRTNRDPGVVEVEADPAKLLPDEDWIGCVAAYALTDCSDCDLDIRGDEAAYDAWAAELPNLVSPAVQEEVSAELEFIQTEIDYDGFCTLPLQAVLGRTVIRDVGRSKRGVGWLRAGLQFADRFAHLGAMPIVGVIDADT
jgi:hypothetical protein